MVVVAVVAAVFAFLWYPATQQPKIKMANLSIMTSGCGLSGPSFWTFVFSFNLVNTGNADGFAVVELYLNGAPNQGTYWTKTYFVPQGTQVTEPGEAFSSTDCGHYSPDAYVMFVRKA